MNNILEAQTLVNECTRNPAVGYTAVVTRSLGDGTRSFHVNNAGRCDLPSAGVACDVAQEEMIEHMKRELTAAIRISATLSPIIDLP